MSGVKKFIPLLDRILVEKISNQATKTTGGIFIPTNKDAPTNNAKVIAVGTGSVKFDGSFIDPIVKEGDIVLINPKARSNTVPWGDKTYHLLSENDILGIIEN
ncbi:hypothetical protein ACTFIY_002217 [Dictyostelium cf. discoideum]